MNEHTQRGLLAFASVALALAGPAGCFSDYANDCSRNPELPCFWGGTGGTGGAGGTTSAPPTCGDGTTDTELGEACDDGNTASGDGCSKKCAEECTTGTFQNALLFFDEAALHCYVRVNGSKKSWIGAQNECKLWNATADLVGFSDAAEVDRVAMSIPATAKAWTGGTDKVTQGVYSWSNGEPFPASVNLWATGQPDDDVANGQQCLSVDGNYKLSDDDCASLLGFVCELDLATLK